eukprot:67332-Prymnesium_polylepis.1
MDGKAIYPHSCFRGVFPQNLSENGFFPWCSFYKGSQRAFLMKEELTSGTHGIEGRYPFLDPDVVQEFLWLSAEVKNSEYKRPVADFLRAGAFPNAWNAKHGFKARENLGVAVPTEVLSDPLLEHIDEGLRMQEKRATGVSDHGGVGGGAAQFKRKRLYRSGLLKAVPVARSVGG